MFYLYIIKIKYTYYICYNYEYIFFFNLFLYISYTEILLIELKIDNVSVKNNNVKFMEKTCRRQIVI